MDISSKDLAKTALINPPNENNAEVMNTEYIMINKWWTCRSVKNKDKTVVERQKRYWAREKEKLSDKYIYHRLLRRRFKKDQITDEMVRQKKSQLLLKKNSV